MFNYFLIVFHSEILFHTFILHVILHKYLLSTHHEFYINVHLLCRFIIKSSPKLFRRFKLQVFVFTIQKRRLSINTVNAVEEKFARNIEKHRNKTL